MPAATQKKTTTAKAAVEAVENAKAAPAKEVPAASGDAQLYENKSTFNVHTEAGRCMPGQTVSLTPEQAKQYDGLEPCQ